LWVGPIYQRYQTFDASTAGLSMGLLKKQAPMQEKISPRRGSALVSFLHPPVTAGTLPTTGAG
jgi:hypothetical protein